MIPLSKEMSPTVVTAYRKKPFWWAVVSDGGWDHQGYDQWGYNRDGLDREGYSREDYLDEENYLMWEHVCTGWGFDGRYPKK